MHVLRFFQCKNISPRTYVHGKFIVRKCFVKSANTDMVHFRPTYHSSCCFSICQYTDIHSQNKLYVSDLSSAPDDPIPSIMVETFSVVSSKAFWVLKSKNSLIPQLYVTLFLMSRYLSSQLQLYNFLWI